jgi:hypothetical protein
VRQIDRVGFPGDFFQVQKNAEFLRARGHREVENMYAFPVKNFGCLDVFAGKFDHFSVPRIFIWLLQRSQPMSGPAATSKALKWAGRSKQPPPQRRSTFCAAPPAAAGEHPGLST